ncbi:hypothetical protein HPP92_020751 [Vanilla planifolia]|uniref:Uncharacterized protein n=1 Tax=Vanilla planifolia TaxID=51239 RepID=A0A835PXM1_VANPL|nr:hypothetical protein HPP92_020751 [Vanilla planifolia]
MEAGNFKTNYANISDLHVSKMDGSQLLLVQKYVNRCNDAKCHSLSPVAEPALFSTSNPPSALRTAHDGDSTEDSEIFSDVVLSYISRMLMEEDVDEKINELYFDNAALQAAEKPFYDILGQQHPPPSPEKLPFCQNHVFEGAKESSNNRDLIGESSSSWVVDPRWIPDSSSNHQLQGHFLSVDYSSQSALGLSNSRTSVSYLLAFTSRSSESQSACQFTRGMEEARKFLPSESSNLLSQHKSEKKKTFVDVQEYAADRQEEFLVDVRSRGKRRPQTVNLDFQEGTTSKQSAMYTEDALRSDLFDKVLLCQSAKNCSLNMSNDTREQALHVQVQGSGNGRKARGKSQQKKDEVDLRTLLVCCAQAVASDDRRHAYELLKQIRKYSSPFGDGSQRLAHCFADGLEARLAGNGSQIYHSLVSKRTTATDILKAYQLYLSACPFMTVSQFFSNQTILNVSENASIVHVIDFGICFGFQWPRLIQRLSSRPGGPPKLRITAVDVPQPGFRPTERIEETGKRLAKYAKCFHVPFEYNAIASKWEMIQVEDLKVGEGEVVIVNCLHRFRNLVDETVVVDSPRNKVLGTIRNANPDVFIQGIVNGSYDAPFFLTRFREALFHYSALFDMLETTVPRDDEQKLLIEKDLFGREALNVTSCEGSERVERPETYKQWQQRNLRAGFTQLPLDSHIVKKAKDKVRGCYHKDFVIHEDSKWLLQGWKGRITFALSTWRANR